VSLLCEEFEWRHKRSGEQTQQRIDTADVRKFVGVREVLYIPRQQKITFMVGRQGQV
jgi:hypothetical protein